MGLRHGHNPKKGVSGTGTSRRGGGGVRNGHLKKGDLKNWSCKKRILVNDVAQKGVLEIIKNRGPKHGQARKGGGGLARVRLEKGGS